MKPALIETPAATDYAPRGRPFTGRKMLLIMLAFFGVIIGVNMTMLTLALKNFGGLATDNAYVASQRFDADRAAALAQPISGWSIDEAYDAQGRLTLTVSDSGPPVSGAVLTGAAARPTHRRSDVALSFREYPVGVYTADTALAPGGWTLDLTAATAGQDPQTRALRLHVPETEPRP